MKRPWMPLYVGDYLADTTHLSAAESGAYMFLIIHYWSNGKLPQDEGAIRRISKLTGPQWKKSRDVMKSFFGDVTTHLWTHKRIDAELAQVIEISEKRSASAKKRHSKTDANAVQLHTHSHSHSQRKKESSDGRKATRPSVPNVVQQEKFEEFMAAYPKRQGGNPKAPAEKHFRSAVSAGADPDAIIAGGKKYAAECRSLGKYGTQYVAQARTWLKDCRWRDYAAAAVAALTPQGHLALDGILFTPRPANPREGII